MCIFSFSFQSLIKSVTRLQFFLKHFCIPPLVTDNKVYSTRRRGPSESNQRARAYRPDIQSQGLNKSSVFIKSARPIPGSHHLSIPSLWEATKSVCTPSIIRSNISTFQLAISTPILTQISVHHKHPLTLKTANTG